MDRLRLFRHQEVERTAPTLQVCVAPAAEEVLVPVAELEWVVEAAVVELCVTAEPSKAVASTAMTLKTIVRIVVNGAPRQLILA